MKRCSTQIGRRLRTAIVFPLVAESALWGAIGLEQLGIGVPLLRQGLGVIFLSFVPGLVIVNILGTRGLSLVEVLLYSVGFSLASVLLVSFAANGDMLVSNLISAEERQRFQLPGSLKRKLTKSEKRFLEYHRRYVFNPS